MTLCLAIGTSARSIQSVVQLITLRTLLRMYATAYVSPAQLHVCTAAACSVMAVNAKTDLSELFSAHRGITSDKITERKVTPLLARE